MITYHMHHTTGYNSSCFIDTTHRQRLRVVPRKVCARRYHAFHLHPLTTDLELTPYLCVQTLASAQDVRTVLDKRFEMTSWFRRHGYPVQHSVDKTVVKCKSVDSLQQLQPVHPAQSVQQAQPQQQLIAAARSRKHTLLLTDFDKTLMDFDAGEIHGPTTPPCPLW
jgi:hypothetical protein